jgi:glycosyltransferase involved in cell wall biosynthesis
LPELLTQDYPTFQVIVINACSTDETETLLMELQKEYPHLYHSFTPEGGRFISNKKLAITLGIKAAKYDWLVFTEAHCQPTSKQWLRLLARNFTPQTDIVLGYSGYQYKKGWMQKKIAFDALFTAMRYLGSAIRKHPYMGLGSNMAYRKTLFYEQKGFSDQLNLLCGDDDLFINRAATTKNTRVETDANAVMQRIPLSHAKTWRENKTNSKVSARKFTGFQPYLWGMETCSRLLFYLTVGCGIALSIINLHWIVGCAVFCLWLIRFAVQTYTINKTASALGEQRRYYLLLPVFDILQAMQSLRFNILCSTRGGFTRKA